MHSVVLDDRRDGFLIVFLLYLGILYGHEKLVDSHVGIEYQGFLQVAFWKKNKKGKLVFHPASNVILQYW